MNKKRLLIAAIVGALVAVAVAVPVIAATFGKPAESGYVRMYNYVNTDDGDDSWEATGTSTVRLAFDATADPYSIAMCVTGTRLKPKTQYALVNIIGFGHEADAPDAEYFVDVTVLGTATTNKLGALSLKACTDYLSDGWNDNDSQYDNVWSRFSGADVWLVPFDAVEVYESENYVNLPSWPNPEACFVFASLGLPTDWEDVFQPYEWTTE